MNGVQIDWQPYLINYKPVNNGSFVNLYSVMEYEKIVSSVMNEYEYRNILKYLKLNFDSENDDNIILMRMFSIFQEGDRDVFFS